MDEAGVRITEHDEGEDTEQGPTVDEESELRQFREFLDDVEPEDFDG
jgi:hypothetical protein